MLHLDGTSGWRDLALCGMQCKIMPLLRPLQAPTEGLRLEPAQVPFPAAMAAQKKEMLKPLKRVFSALRNPSAYARAYSGTFFWPIILPLREYQLRQVAKEAVKGLEGGLLLDIGSSYGYLLGEMALKRPAVQAVGVDIDARLVGDAVKYMQSRKLGNNVTLMAAMAEHLPFRDATFDLVLCTMSFHLWKDRQKGVDEMRRVLRPGGRATVLVGRHYFLRGLGFITDLFTGKSRDAVAAYFSAAGFSQFKVHLIDDEIIRVNAVR